ncbi:Tex-like N-terminal domain-containing protein [Aeoliella mucimassa]|uniref:30S ribosomal protein S1 n=1 Tax=Aeoliella mucimassa TaxID=2527972 RepID=A0A518AHR9_9BACT|nr:Tex family protein [Aeoliella mucimassa]QDU54255.1 30S ribosomal protein S1 [Aeoliella mucimassa]
MDSSLAVDLTRVARSTKLPVEQVRATVELLDAGNTIPFITRYRRDQTGGLDEEQIEHIRAAVADLRNLEARKGTILRSLESQHKLTDELRASVEAAETLRRLEDLYLPYKPKKQSLASKAREQGLEPLAMEILDQAEAAQDLDARAAQFVSEDRKVENGAAALIGAGHILAERYSEQAELRQRLRKLYRKTGKLVATKISDDHKKNAQFKDYFDYREPLSRVPPHRVLAINRGEKAKVLRVGVECDAAALEQLAIEQAVPAEHAHAEYLRGCMKDALERLVLPSLERESRRELTDKAETHAIEVFARNLRALLLQPPVPGRRVLAIDPGYKNGCKLAMIDEHGNLVTIGLVNITGSEEKTAEARTQLLEFIREHSPSVIAIGNGSACRPTENMVSELLAGELADTEIQYVIVNEAGASVYSTSAIGREEFPDCEAIDRSAISIGRRLQDPLSELVKIDPASIGVGLYQHDAKPAHLKDTLNQTVESCVSFVGVDVNTASSALLKNVAGLNQLVARRILEHRTEKGPFQSRQQLLDVNGLGEATFVQAAGFLKIDGGDNPLDTTWVHPESYAAAERLLSELGIETSEVGREGWAKKFAAALEGRDRAELAAKLELGEHSVAQLIEALERPGRDLRSDLPPPVFRRDVVKLDDLEVGMKLSGTVLNVVDFGAFVDVGLSDSGLVHVSQMQNDYVRDPHQVVSVGDQVDCWVTAIDTERRRVALTMIEPGTERPKPEKAPRRRPKRRPQKPKTDSSGAKPGEAAPAAGSGGGEQGASASTSSRPPRSGGGRRDDSRGSAGGGGGGRRGDRRGRRGEKPQRPRTGSFEKRAKREVVPLTKEMEEGKEAMRSFSDLLQFHKKQSTKDKQDDSNSGS